MVSQRQNACASAALRRRAGRQAERGAAVFIVVMVMTLLTALGIFAVRSASLADVAAGYDREGAQASLVAQYGVTATTSYMATEIGPTILDKLEQSITQVNPPSCQANFLAAPIAAPGPRPACYTLGVPQLETSFIANSNETVFAPANLTGGPTGSTSSLNANETTNATFVVELTEGAKTGIPAPGSGDSVMVTLTAIAQVRPAAACADTNTSPAAGQQVMRAMITAQKAPK